MSPARARVLHDELKECQRRLGTLAEQAGDFDRVLYLAHELNNQMTVEFLAEDERASPAPRSPLQIFRSWISR